MTKKLLDIELRTVWSNPETQSGIGESNVIFINGKRATNEDIPSTPAYEAIKAQAEKVNWPKHFTDDLHKHDRLELYRNEYREFIWILRECGTWLIPNQDARDILKYCLSGGENYLYYHYRNGELYLIDPGIALATLDEIDPRV